MFKLSFHIVLFFFFFFPFFFNPISLYLLLFLSFHFFLKLFLLTLNFCCLFRFPNIWLNLICRVRFCPRRRRVIILCINRIILHPCGLIISFIRLVLSIFYPWRGVSSIWYIFRPRRLIIGLCRLRLIASFISPRRLRWRICIVFYPTWRSITFLHELIDWTIIVGLSLSRHTFSLGLGAFTGLRFIIFFHGFY